MVHFSRLLLRSNKIVNKPSPFLDDGLDNEFIFFTLIAAFLYSFKLKDFFVSAAAVAANPISLTVVGFASALVGTGGIRPRAIQVHFRFNNIAQL